MIRGMLGASTNSQVWKKRFLTTLKPVAVAFSVYLLIVRIVICRCNHSLFTAPFTVGVFKGVLTFIIILYIYHIFSDLSIKELDFVQDCTGILSAS